MRTRLRGGRGGRGACPSPLQILWSRIRKWKGPLSAPSAVPFSRGPGAPRRPPRAFAFVWFIFCVGRRCVTDPRLVLGRDRPPFRSCGAELEKRKVHYLLPPPRPSPCYSFAFGRLSLSCATELASRSAVASSEELAKSRVRRGGRGVFVPPSDPVEQN